MAQKVTVVKVDDLSGIESGDVDTVEFALDGITYEIDLTPDNADRLRDELADFVARARRTGGRIKRGLGAAAHHTELLVGERPGSMLPARRSPDQLRAIRDWARSQGRAVADRGRVPARVIEEFDKAHTAPAVRRGGKPRVRG